MPPPEPPSKASAEAPSKTKGCVAVLMALGLAALVFAGLFLLTSGRIAIAAVIAAVIFGAVALHYVIWGWWLSGIIREQVEDEEGD
jgi:hypothetical protein